METTTTNETTTTRNPLAIFMMGGPGSGKTTVRKREYGDLFAIDSDEIKAEHPEYDPKNPQPLYEWANVEADKKFFDAVEKGIDLVYDGTGSRSDAYVSFMNCAHRRGYDVDLVYVETDVETAVRRNAERERTIAESIVREKHARVAATFGFLARFADSYRIVRT